jgi:hypothetical protein
LETIYPVHEKISVIKKSIKGDASDDSSLEEIITAIHYSRNSLIIKFQGFPNSCQDFVLPLSVFCRLQNLPTLQSAINLPSQRRTVPNNYA